MVGAAAGGDNGRPVTKERPPMSYRKFTREFKISAVQLVNVQGYSIPEAAKSLGVDKSSIRDWLKKYGGEAGPVPPTGEGANAAELRRLRQENARLRMERDILKKAAAFFAKEQP
jgi:transposase-like protein